MEVNGYIYNRYFTIAAATDKISTSATRNISSRTKSRIVVSQLHTVTVLHSLHESSAELNLPDIALKIVQRIFDHTSSTPRQSALYRLSRGH